MEQMFNAVLIGMLDLANCPSLDTYTQSNQSSVGFPKIEKQTDREKWLMLQVYPALAQHLSAEPDSAAIKLIERLIAFHRR